MTAKVKAIRNLYKHGKLTKQEIYNSVPDVITADEYFEITGEVYGG